MNTDAAPKAWRPQAVSVRGDILAILKFYKVLLHWSFKIPKQNFKCEIYPISRLLPFLKFLAVHIFQT